MHENWFSLIKHFDYHHYIPTNIHLYEHRNNSKLLIFTTSFLFVVVNF